MSINGLILNDAEWMETIEEKFDEYQDVLFSILDDEEGEETGETLSGEPFCGCNTCHMRETIVFLAPYIIRGYKEGKISLED
jgi:hypothetical protein